MIFKENLHILIFVRQAAQGFCHVQKKKKLNSLVSALQNTVKHPPNLYQGETVTILVTVGIAILSSMCSFYTPTLYNVNLNLSLAMSNKPTRDCQS